MNAKELKANKAKWAEFRKQFPITIKIEDMGSWQFENIPKLPGASKLIHEFPADKTKVKIKDVIPIYPNPKK